MGTEQDKRVESLFQQAVDLPPAARSSFLDARCDGDGQVRREVELLLSHFEEAQGGFLEDGACEPIDPVTEPAACPQQIGHYRIVRKIGEGGMGVVYEALQDNPVRTVSLKILRPGLASRDLLRRFQRETEVLGRLQHAGIAHIYEAGAVELAGPGGLTTRQPFFAMEFISGRPLNEFARAHELGVRERLQLLAKVCDAVQHAHQHGVIHRDLKPANILVQEETKRRRDEETKYAGASPPPPAQTPISSTSSLRLFVSISATQDSRLRRGAAYSRR